MKDAYTKLMLQQHTVKDAAFYEKMEQAQPKKRVKPILRAAIVAACLCLMVPVTAWAAKNIFGVTKITIEDGKDFYGKDAVVMHRDVENVEHIPITEFSPYLQELKETEWLYFDSWEDAEEKIGIDFISNTVLTDGISQPYARKKKYGHDERGIAYAALNTKSTPYTGVYYAADEQLFAVSFSAEYWRHRTRFMITANMTTDHPLMTEELFLVYHGFGERYYEETDKITVEQYVTENGIPVTIYYSKADDWKYIDPMAYFSVNNVSYHVQITSWGGNYDEKTAEDTNERLINFVKEILEGFTVE